MAFLSNAQNFEDILLWRALGNFANGFYVDVGAADPVLDSVTNAFYERGWTGINIEPLQHFYRRLCKLRENDINLPVCAGKKDGELLLYEIPEYGSSTCEQAVAELAKEAGWQVLEQVSEVLTINTVLERYSQGRAISFLKIDAEGAEKAVLEGLDLSRWRPWIILIDTTIPFSTDLSSSGWEDILDASHYILAYSDGSNRFYGAEEKSELISLLRVPPDFFDHLIVDDRYYAESEQNHPHVQSERIRTERDALKIEWDRMRIQRDKLRVERDELKVALNQVRNSYSWHLTAPLRRILGTSKIAGVLNGLFPLSTLPKRAISKLIRLPPTQMTTQPTINRLVSQVARRFPVLTSKLKNWAFQADQKTLPYYSVFNDDSGMSPQVRRIYFDLVSSVKTQDALARRERR